MEDVGHVDVEWRHSVDDCRGGDVGLYTGVFGKSECRVKTKVRVGGGGK